MSHPITTFRQKENLTLARFGELAGLSKGFVCDVEAGRKKLGPDKAREVEAATGIPKHVLRPDLWEAPKAERAAS
jgi:transcriptional regulator with XRE-family HTH domain